VGSRGAKHLREQNKQERFDVSTSLQPLPGKTTDAFAKQTFFLSPVFAALYCCSGG
jgi:hypothetical protein